MTCGISCLASCDGEACITAPRKLGFFGDDLHFVSLQTNTDTCAELLEDLRLACHHLAEVEGCFGDGETVFLSLKSFGEEVSGVK